ncbi:PRP38 family protein [Perilla frutescens var. hirtella]|nr:PRP38 family protein [Perilla frutescens var. hirtella]
MCVCVVRTGLSIMSEIKSSGRPFDQLLEKVLCMNILSSEYFRDLLQLKTYHEVIDEIYVTVTHVEPWMTGNCRGPSTAFCLLYKFFMMKLTVKQMHGLLNHPDSPYIRAIGFLYLRYAADPKTLWSWYEPFLKDDEEFSPGSNGRMTTMGVYVRDLLLGQYYFDTLFPRIPVLVVRTIVANLENMKLPSKHCGVTGETIRGGEETARRPPSVKAALSVSFGQRAPHRTSTRDSSPVRRTVTHSYDRDNESRQSPNLAGNQKGPETPIEGIMIGEAVTNTTGEKEKISASSNLAKLKDMYGVLSNQKDGMAENKGPNRHSGTEEVIRLGGSSWR